MPSMLFAANDANTTDYELWVTDGTALRTHEVADINPGSAGSFPSNYKLGSGIGSQLPFAVLNGYGYFSATNANGSQLWRSDGTSGGTTEITNFAGGVGPQNIVAANGLIFYSGNGAGGFGIYKTDGVNTTFVSAASQLTAMVSTGSRVYWTTEPGNGSSVTTSDGTTTSGVGSSTGASTLFDAGGGAFYYGTNSGIFKLSGASMTQVTGLPGFPSGSMSTLTNAGGTVFFTTAQNPTSLYITATNTTTATQIKTGLDLNNALQGGATPPQFAALGTKLIFANNDDNDGNNNTNTGNELWISDGTTNGTVLLKDIITGSLPGNVAKSSNPKDFVTVGSVVFFQASDGNFGPNNGFGYPSGLDLWKTDGTANGTVLVKHIASANPTSNGLQAPPDFSEMRNVNGILYFGADTGTGVELWRSDGTDAGTFKVSEIAPNGQPGGAYTDYNSANGVTIGTTTFFMGADNTNGYEVWITNGTNAGTTLLKDINPGTVNSLPGPFIALGNKAIFVASDNTHGRELWISDGTGAGTQLLRDINANGDAFATYVTSQFFDVLGSTLLFAADDGINGQELWATDGTTNGTVLLADLFPGSTNGFPNASGPAGFVNVGSNAFFVANSAVGSELHVTDGTSLGTHLVKDIAPGSNGGTQNSPQIQSMTAYQNKLFFAASNVHDGLNTELWSSDGTAGGTSVVKEINTGPAQPGDPGYDPNNPAAGSANVNSLVVANGHLFFFASTIGGFAAVPELWMSDGTAATTVQLSNIANHQPQSLVSVGNRVYYTGFDSTHGTEVFTSTGAAPTAIDIVAGINSSSPNNLTAVGTTLFFSAQDTAANGFELWVANGTTAQMVKDINPTANAGSNPSNFLAAGNRLFFVADDGVHGQELWVSDGVVNGAGTHMVKDINTAANQGSSVFGLKVIANGDVLFQANDGTNGTELYITDGTSNGTFRVTDLQTPDSANPANFTSIPLDLSGGPETLTGTPQVDFIDGGGGADVISGLASDDTLLGGAGNDFIDGGPGNDTMIGGLNDDTYVVDSPGDVVTELFNQGTDTVLTGIGSYTLPVNVENLTGTSGTGQFLTGNAGDNVISGGPGADAMTGGAGNDTYVVNNAGDAVVENANEGTDTVVSSISYTLPTNVENLNLTGNADLQAYGNAAANTINGNTGNNLIDGGANGDIMAGGAGNDTYFVDNPGDVVVEGANAGNDTIFASTSYTMPANVETLVLQGSANLQAYGSSGPNTIYGNTGNNLIDGGAGADLLIGGAGDDAYFVDNAGDSITENANEGTDTVFSTVNYTLNANVEILTLQGAADLQGYGNTLANTIYGNSGNNLIDGGAGADNMLGGAGNDTYFVDNAADQVTENANEGNDSVFSTADFTLGANVENLILQGSADLQGYGNTLGNTIYGNAGNNLLNGGAGADLMVGGTGNDTYFVDNISDSAFESPNEGNDTVFTTVNYNLAADVETLVMQGSADLQGYGNNQVNTLFGNSGNNLINGAGGADLMEGGAGNDTYFVDNSADMIVENANEGSDAAFTSANYTLSANVETLVMQGSADLQGYGNSQANTLYGNSGNNLIDGGAGADTMLGGAGNDTYFVDNGSDITFENANEGNDTVFSVVHWILGSNVENLVLQGAVNLNGTGNALSNSMFGNTGDNILDGQGGADTLTGGAGNDTFLFNVGQGNGDTVVDFAGNGAAAGDSLKFVGYGAGATFTNIDATHWQVNYNGGASHDIITFSNGAAIDPTDFQFV